MGKTCITRNEGLRNIRRTRNVVRVLIAILLVSTMAGECSATDVGAFLSRCKWLQDVATGKKKPSILDEKNFFWCAGHLSGILEGYRIGLLVRGDLDFAKSVSICPPQNATDAGLVGVVLNELQAQEIKDSTTLATAVTAILSIKWPCR